MSTCHLLFFGWRPELSQEQHCCPQYRLGVLLACCVKQMAAGDGVWGCLSDKQTWEEVGSGQRGSCLCPECLCLSPAQPSAPGGGWTVSRGWGKHICLGLVVAREEPLGWLQLWLHGGPLASSACQNWGGPFHEASGTPGCTPEAPRLGRVWKRLSVETEAGQAHRCAPELLLVPSQLSKTMQQSEVEIMVGFMTSCHWSA